MSLRRTIFERLISKNLSQRSLKVIAVLPLNRFAMVLLLFYSNFVPKTHRFCDVGLVSIPYLETRVRSLKVIGIDTDQSITYDFLLTFHSNHEPISYHFRDKWRFQSKIVNFLTLPLRGIQFVNSPYTDLIVSLQCIQLLTQFVQFRCF